MKANSKNNFSGKSLFTYGNISPGRSRVASPSNVNPSSGFSWDSLMQRVTSPKNDTPKQSLTENALNKSFASIGKSYNNVIGGGSGMDSTMSGLEASSMRLADAAARRNIAEKAAGSELEAIQAGFSGLDEMSEYLKRKRREAESMQYR